MASATSPALMTPLDVTHVSHVNCMEVSELSPTEQLMQKLAHLSNGDMLVDMISTPRTGATALEPAIISVTELE